MSEQESVGRRVARYIEQTIFKTTVAPEDCAAIVVEPVQGEGGYVVPPPGWIAMPDRREAFTDRRRSPAAQPEHVSRAEGQAHHAVAGHAFAIGRRKLGALLDLPGELGRLPHSANHRGLTSSVAEDGRVAACPLPHRCRACDLGARDPVSPAEVAGVEADRAQPELPAGLGELLREALERRAQMRALLRQARKVLKELR